MGRWVDPFFDEIFLTCVKGSLFGPYTPLQQLDILADYGTKSYIVGSTNSLLLQQKDRYSDILINLDEDTINISSPSLRSALTLSLADRRWIDFITQSVNDTWDENNPSRPKTMGYVGSEEFIRLQFEEYLLSLISSVKCHSYLQHHAHNPSAHLPVVDGDPSLDFGADWIEAWTRSENYRIWDRHTDTHLFDVVEPKHPCAGGLTIDDVQRRIAEQVKEFHLDERFAVGKETLNRNLQAGREKANTVFNKLYADMEALRESQRRKQEAQRRDERAGGASPGFQAPDLNGAKHGLQSVGSKAGAYIGSWGTWMGEKRKTGWGRSPSGNQTATVKKEKEVVRDEMPAPVDVSPPVTGDAKPRPQSYNENLFDADSKAEPPLSSPPAQDPNTPPQHQAHPSKFHEGIDDSPTSDPHPNPSSPSKPTDPTPEPDRTLPPAPESSDPAHAVAEAIHDAHLAPLTTPA